MVHTYLSLVMPYGTVDIQCASEEQRDFMLIGIMSFIAQERSKYVMFHDVPPCSTDSRHSNTFSALNTVTD